MWTWSAAIISARNRNIESATKTNSETVPIEANAHRVGRDLNWMQRTSSLLRGRCGLCAAQRISRSRTAPVPSGRVRLLSGLFGQSVLTPELRPSGLRAGFSNISLKATLGVHVRRPGNALGIALRPIGSRGLFIQTAETPNPASLKFIPGEQVLPTEYGTSMDFTRDSDTSNSPLARLLLRVQGVTGVFLSNDFITVSKEDSMDWSQLKPEIFATIMDFYAADKPAVTGPVTSHDDFVDGEDSEIVELIRELLEERIRPMVQEDGGDIFFKGFDEDTGIVKVQLAGSCAGCPSSTVTLQSGVENMLMHYIPEINGVESVGDMDVDPDARSLHFTPTTP